MGIENEHFMGGWHGHPPDQKLWDQLGKPRERTSAEKLESEKIWLESNKLSIEFLTEQRDLYVETSKIPVILRDDIKAFQMLIEKRRLKIEKMESNLNKNE